MKSNCNDFFFDNYISTVWNREKIVNSMFYCEVKEQEFIFKQGDNASSYFILGNEVNRF